MSQTQYYVLNYDGLKIIIVINIIICKNVHA